MIHDKPTLVENHAVTVQGCDVESAPNETELLFNWCELPEKLIETLFQHHPEANVLGSSLYDFKLRCAGWTDSRKRIMSS